MSHKTIGEFLRTHRESMGLSQQQVVSELRLLDVTSLNNIENGLMEPDVDTIFALSNVLGIQPDLVVRAYYNILFPNSNPPSSGW